MDELRRYGLGIAIGLVGVMALSLVWLANMRQPAQAQVGANLPFATGVSVLNSVTTIIGPNPTRRGLKICNVGATNDVWIAPINIGGTAVTPAALGAGSFLLSRGSAAGANVVVNCLNMPADVVGGGASSVSPSIAAGFAGITNASTSPVTVWEY